MSGPLSIHSLCVFLVFWLIFAMEMVMAHVCVDVQFLWNAVDDKVCTSFFLVSNDGLCVPWSVVIVKDELWFLICGAHR